MRNLDKHPITIEEAVKVLREVANELEEENDRKRAYGDMRPAVLKWTAYRLLRLQFSSGEK